MGALRSAISKALNFAYPPVCISCGAIAGSHHPLLLCGKCLETVVSRPRHMCPRCGAAMYREPEPGAPCPRCYKDHINFAQAVSAGDYEGPLGSVVRTLKFGRMRSLAAPLAGELADAVASGGLHGEVDIVTTVPLHWTRFMKRGFNQSALIAKNVARRLRLKYARTLRRVRRTTPQTRLSAAARRKNPLNAFAAVGKEKVAGKNMLLIDDVMTTGGTLMECTRILRRAGAKKIYVAVVAR